MRKTLFFIPLISLIFLSGSCHKDTQPQEDQLPHLTQTGANTFGCKINGELFICKGAENSFSHIGVAFNSSFFISASNHTSPNHIFISFNPASKIGYIRLTDSLYIDSMTRNWGKMEGDFKVDGSEMYITDSLRTGYVNITYYNGNILAGTFSFDAINNMGEILHITEGRFDIAKQ